MTSTYRKKLIEVAVPLDAINKASAREKSIRHGHPSTIHLWWARRPLASARAVLFAQLVDDPGSWPEFFPTVSDQTAERRRLFSLIERLVLWESTSDERVLADARQAIAISWARSHPSEAGERVLRGASAKDVAAYLATELPVFHDPFAGGGSIPLEAQRLGLRVLASDLNPVAVAMNKALVDVPSAFAGRESVSSGDAQQRAHASTRARGLASDVIHYGKWMQQIAHARLANLYPEVSLPADLGGGCGRVLAWLWARTVASPDPAARGAHVPLTTTFWLSKKAGKEAWIEAVPNLERRTCTFRVRRGKPTNKPLVDRGTRAGKAQDFVCLFTGSPIPRDYIRDEGKAGRMGECLLAVAVETTGGRAYVDATEEMEALARSAGVRAGVADARETFLAGSTPTRAMITGGVCSAYGLSTWGHLFTSRQLATLLTFADLVDEARAAVHADALKAGLPDGEDLEAGGVGARAYSQAVSLYLALCVSKLSVFTNTAARWRAGEGKSAPAFGRQALPMVWDFAEINPFAGAGGDFLGIVDGTAKVVAALPATPRAHALNHDAAGDSASLPQTIVCSMDPPYYDNISALTVT